MPCFLFSLNSMWKELCNFSLASSSAWGWKTDYERDKGRKKKTWKALRE